VLGLPPVTRGYYASRPLPCDPGRKREEFRQLLVDIGEPVIESRTVGSLEEAHAFRETTDSPWQPFHGQQQREYQVLALARRLAGDDVALQCISIGGPQILVSFFRTLGYGSPRAMFDAWQADERAHVLGFFDLCARSATPATGDRLRYLREQRFDQVGVAVAAER